MKHESLGDYLKAFEATETARRFSPDVPVYARLDGRSFSRFTRGMDRPFDARLSDIMRAVTRFLVEESGAVVGYTQSDEISLAWVGGPLFFEGKAQKMVSVLAALATSRFTTLALDVWRERVLSLTPTFDCRVFALPTEDDAAKCFLWRERDAIKNAVTMAAGTVYSHKQLLNKHGDEKVAMLAEKGIAFDDYPEFFRRGSYSARRQELRTLTDEEMAAIPEKYRPEGPVVRSVVRSVAMPLMERVANRAGVLFRGEEAIELSP